MRNDFGSRPYKVRFPYKAGKSAKKQTADDKLDESLGEDVVRNLQKVKALHLEDMRAKAQVRLNYGRNKIWNN